MFDQPEGQTLRICKQQLSALKTLLYPLVELRLHLYAQRRLLIHLGTREFPREKCTVTHAWNPLGEIGRGQQRQEDGQPKIYEKVKTLYLLRALSKIVSQDKPVEISLKLYRPSNIFLARNFFFAYLSQM